MPVGKIKVWLEHRGFGFIITEGSKQAPDIFVRISDIKYRPVRQGDIVNFTLKFDSQGRPLALNVTKAEDGTPLSVWDELPEVRAKKARELYGEALIARNEKDYPRARQLFEQAILLSPERNFFEAYAAMEKNLGNWDRVREIYSKAIKHFPNDVFILENLAMSERRAGNFDKCVEILRKALEKEPQIPSLHIHLAEMLVDLADRTGKFDQIEEAKKHFSIARRMLSGSFNAEERGSYHKMWILYQMRSRFAWFLFRKAGFQLVKWRVNISYERNVPMNAWILADPSNSRYSQSYHLDGFVLIYCDYARKITEASVRRAEETLKELVEGNPRIRIKPDMLFIILPEIGNLQNYLRLLLEDPESHPTVIPIEEFKVDQLINNNDQEALYNYLDQLLREWLLQRDLYKGNFPVSGRMFFGREKEIGLLNRNIEEGRSTGIFGLRKCGKTSLMYQLKLIRKNDIVAYIDPEASPLRDASWLCWRAIQEFARQRGRAGESILSLEGESIPSLEKVWIEKDLPDFSKVAVDFVSDIRTLMKNTLPEARLILMIDEIEKVVPPRGEGWEHALEFFRLLRGMAQESQGRLVVIIAGANPAICEMSQWHGADNPVFQFFEEMFLPLLPENECKEMIVTLGQGMGVHWEDDALRLVYNLTGGHPFITRRLCSAVVSRFRERPLLVSATMIREMESEFIMRLDEVFSEIRERLQRDYPDEWTVLEAIAYDFSFDEIKQLVPSYARALRHLEGYQLVEFVNGQPQIKISLFKKWLTEG
jgi:cold shock CspA family protein